ncbi:leucine--tRNA ligase [Patescibacteria group bacterium]
MENYNPKEIEPKWQKKWEDKHLFEADDFSDKEKKYILLEFPYPSGAGLHVGHVRSYTALDVIARKLRMQNKNVLYPVGWDAFGLPTENYAIKNKIHPKIATEQNIGTFKKQIKSIGISFDWNREINTTDPDYYKWTQWIFLKLLENGLAYKDNIAINWCPSCKIGLANEEVVDGKCERCGAQTEKRQKEQWMLAITKYAERLIDDLDTVDYLDKIKTQQVNWIGKSEGATVKFEIRNSKFEINFKIQNSNNKIDYLEVFTTRPDTLFGCTYMVVCPEHSLIANFESSISNIDEVKRYIEQSQKKSDLERTDLAKEKTGVKLEGLMAVNPVNNEEIPIFVADYVLSGYGTGAIMAVPAHDERDLEFAKKYGLEIKEVVLANNTKTPSNEEAFGDREDSCPRRKITNCHYINSIYDNKEFVKSKGAEPMEGLEPSNHQVTIRDQHHATGSSAPNLLYQKNSEISNKCFISEGININSDFLDGLKTNQAKEKIIKWLEKKKVGEKKVQYKLRDWVFSRQHYWGEPIPVVHCKKCGIVPLPEDQLPLELPDVRNYEPTDTGESPLANIKDWVNTTCPKCNGPAKRETDTMPNWAGSSWYFLRYIDSQNGKALADPKKLKYWMPVDLYNGGMEHTTLHLLYSRFWNKFLYDIGVIPTSEPYAKRVSHGMVLAEDGKKMSKSLDNVINPDDVIKQFGADTLRVYEMFMGPYGEAIPWSTDGLKGVRRFLDRVWNLQNKIVGAQNFAPADKIVGAIHELPKSVSLESLVHKTVKKVTEDIENFKFNTAISAMMILVNEMEKEKEIALEDYKLLLLILSPFAPHLCEELLEIIQIDECKKIENRKSKIKNLEWPSYDSALVKDDTINLVIQINGKLRDKVEVSADISEEDAKKISLEREKIKEWVKGKDVVKVIFVKGKLVNIVIRDTD